jgi:hypothetical protein
MVDLDREVHLAAGGQLPLQDKLLQLEPFQLQALEPIHLWLCNHLHL